MTSLDQASFTVVSTMKNEGPYVLDWVAHHKVLGFDNIVVCTNDCDDGTDAILDLLQTQGLLRHHRTKIWPRAGIHRSALKQSQRYGETTKADWIYVCDVDEYLSVKTGDGSVRGLVEGAGADVDVISIPWRLFGPNGIKQMRDEPVTRQFTDAEADATVNPKAGKFVKSIFTGLKDVKRMGLHAPIFNPELERPLKRVLPGGLLYTQDGQRTENPPLFDVAQVNHYALRSVDSFLIKRDRGRANHMSDTIGFKYWKRHDRGGVPDTSVGRYEQDTQIWRDRLAEATEMRELHLKAVEWHRNKAAELRARDDLQPLIEAVEKTLTT